jgi:hypothetical protein
MYFFKDLRNEAFKGHKQPHFKTRRLRLCRWWITEYERRVTHTTPKMGLLMYRENASYSQVGLLQHRDFPNCCQHQPPVRSSRDKHVWNLYELLSRQVAYLTLTLTLTLTTHTPQRKKKM